MPFSVNDFRANLQFDGSRPNLFEIYLTFPNQVLGAGAAAQKLTLTAKAAQIPGSTIGTVPLYYFGREVKIPGNRMFQDWMIQVINDEDFTTRNAFENWLNSINSHVGNVRDPSMVSSLGYAVKASALQYGKAGVPIAQYDFTGMFPVDLAPIDLDWGANDSISEWGVTLAYQYWEKLLPFPVTD